jgi:dolichyl-phosphate-mannose-protein mannosyltransferase
VHSRTGLLDLFVMFWALAAFGALLIDRDQTRERLAVEVARARTAGGRVSARVEGAGPRLGARWWRVVAAVCLGLCCGTKWSGVYFLAAFGLMTVLWDVGARRAAGVRRWVRAGLLRDGVPAFVTLVPVALLTYLVSWTGWFTTKGGWDRDWAVTHPSKDFGVVPGALRSLWHYHAEMLKFHLGLDSPHPYKTNPWSWVIQGRPTSFFYEGPKQGQDGCTVAQCSKAITSIGTPTLWWGGALAVVVLLAVWALRRDWRAGAILTGFAAGYLPWFAYQHRTIYSFYAIAFVPWMVLAVTYVLGMVLGSPTASPVRRLVGTLLAGSFVVSCVMLFFFFYPVYTAQVIPFSEWARRMWFPSWI